MLRLRREHPRVEPARHALLRDDRRDRRLRRQELRVLVRPRGTERRAAVLEQVDLVGREPPVLLDERPLLLEQRDRRGELRLRELVRILDPERRLRLRQVERRVGDLDRVVRDRDLALVLRVVDRGPARRLLLALRVVEQHVRPELQRDAVVLPVDRVVRRRLERLEEVLVRRDQGRCSSRPPRPSRSAAGSRHPRPRPCRTGRRRPRSSG